MKRPFALFFITLLLFISGCGYTTQSLLPSDLKTIYVSNFKNSIKITAEQSNLRMYRGYRPGMERDLTKVVNDKFLADGNLRIARESDADLILEGELTDFRRGGLRYDTNDNVEEYRLELVVNIELKNLKTGKVVWTEKGFAGETNYMTTGSLAKTESAAINDAIIDLARRIVERTIEAW
jgi:hypothetical protein